MAVATLDQARRIFAGRDPLFWNFLDDHFNDTDWNTVSSEYNTLETGVDNNTVEGVIPCPTRPFPTTRP